MIFALIFFSDFTTSVVVNVCNAGDFYSQLHEQYLYHLINYKKFAIGMERGKTIFKITKLVLEIADVYVRIFMVFKVSRLFSDEEVRFILDKITNLTQVSEGIINEMDRILNVNNPEVIMLSFQQLEGWEKGLVENHTAARKLEDDFRIFLLERIKGIPVSMETWFNTDDHRQNETD